MINFFILIFLLVLCKGIKSETLLQISIPLAKAGSNCIAVRQNLMVISQNKLFNLMA